MIVDDRLETVLGTQATGPAAARTQFRQIVDLLSRGDGIPPAAIDRLESLERWIPEAERAAILDRAGIRSSALVAHFAQGSPRIAAAALRGARLGEAQWLELIPALPLAARGFLRHRRDMGPEVDRLLAQFGIGDAVLPLPEGYVTQPAPRADSPRPVPPRRAQPEPDPREGIGAIVRRIEAFRRKREHPADESGQPGEAPHLPFPDGFAGAQPEAIDIACDAEGMIVAASGGYAPMLVGHRPFAAEREAPARCDADTLAAVRQRRPVAAGRIELEGAPVIAGSWQIDAVPGFSSAGGHFTGWQGRLRRPPPRAAQDAARAANDDERDSGDRLRQMLHELRTPINAIQGFAELIHQQVMGPVSHQYRSYAAHIAGDAARMLAGFEEVDRLVKFETGRLAADSGHADAGEIVRQVLAQVQPLFDQRSVRLRATLTDEPLPVGVAPDELEEMLWRLLSVIAASTGPGERLAIDLAADGDALMLSLTLPAALAAREGAELYAPAARGAGSSPGSLLGNGFALRLAAAEARAVGGKLIRAGNLFALRLPLLTASHP